MNAERKCDIFQREFLFEQCYEKGHTLTRGEAMRYQFQVILECDEEDGGYIVGVPALPGCVTQGDTREEALKMAEDAIRGYIESLRKHNEPLPRQRVR